MGFFNNIGVSYEYLYDLMEFDPLPTVDIGSYDLDPGEVVEKAIVKEKSGFCIRIRREKQKRARLLRFSYIDIIRLIETENPDLKNEKISRIVFSPAYIYNTFGYRGKSICMRIDFGDKVASRGNGFFISMFSPVYQYTHQYLLGHKFLDIIS